MCSGLRSKHLWPLWVGYAIKSFTFKVHVGLLDVHLWHASNVFCRAFTATDFCGQAALACFALACCLQLLTASTGIKTSWLAANHAAVGSVVMSTSSCMPAQRFARDVV